MLGQKKKQSNFFRITFLCVVFSLSFTSCSKNPKCWGEDKNKGIIVNAIRIECSPEVLQDGYLITSDSAYQKIFTNPVSGKVDCSLPSIDFALNSLLGYTVSGQCEIKMIREVTNQPDQSKYHYKLIINNCGLCKKLVYADNWVIVPKLPVGWNVTFEIKEK